MGGVDADAQEHTPRKKVARNVGTSLRNIGRVDRSKLRRDFTKRPNRAVTKKRQKGKKGKTLKKGKRKSKKSSTGGKRTRRPKSIAQCRRGCSKRFKKNKSKRRRCVRACSRAKGQ
jgi:hypothetical protein